MPALMMLPPDRHPWPQPGKTQPPFVEELSQMLRKTQIRDTNFQSPPPASRETSLSTPHYASPCCSPSSDPTRAHVRTSAEPWMKPLPPLPDQRPSQTTQLPFYQVPPPSEAYPVHSQFAPEAEPMSRISLATARSKLHGI